MATPLRYALIFLLWAMVAVIYAPLIPAALTLISPALSLTHWQTLFADPQLPQALLATLVSTTIAAVGALLIALLVIVALWPGPKWQRMCARLPWLLAIPHVAFATSALLLFADGGLLYDYFPYFTPPMDRFGIGLGLTLAVKESAFLLWILAAVLSEKWLLQQVIVLDSLGYSRWQCLNWLLLPSVAPALAMAMLAIVAWSLSVVDVAIILGPGNPPTLAVISWQWLTQGDADQQTKGALASLLLMLLLAAYVLLSYLLWRSWRRTIPRVDGVRKPATPLLPGNTLAIFLPLTGVLCVVLLAILADQSTINSEALINSLTMGLVAADKVTATITDKNGAVVRTIDIGELTAGVHSFTWDGTLTDGSTAPNGSYNVAISASNGGTQLVAQPLQFALVQGVIRGNSGNTLDLGTYGTTTLDEVRQII